MTKKIRSMILNDFERPGILNLFIDFKRNNEIGYLDEIEIPNEAADYMIEIQVNDQDEIVALDIINFPVFLKNIDEDIYLPDLGLFTYKQFLEMPLKEILKSIDFNNFE